MDYTTTIKMVRHDGPLTVLSLENETGTAEMNNWEVYPGITLSYLEAHMEEFSCYAPLRPDVFASITAKKGASNAGSKTENTCIWARATCPSAAAAAATTATWLIFPRPIITAYPS